MNFRYRPLFPHDFFICYMHILSYNSRYRQVYLLYSFGIDNVNFVILIIMEIKKIDNRKIIYLSILGHRESHNFIDINSHLN